MDSPVEQTRVRDVQQLNIKEYQMVLRMVLSCLFHGLLRYRPFRLDRNGLRVSRKPPR